MGFVPGPHGGRRSEACDLGGDDRRGRGVDAAAMNRKNFEKLVNEAIEELPSEFRGQLENVVIIVEDRPSQDLLERMEVPPEDTLFGLYEGTPLTERGFDAPLYPDRIWIFQQPIEAPPEDTVVGLEEGTPLTERGFDAPLYPDRIWIFQQPIEAPPEDTLFGLYEGTPLTERGFDAPLYPDRIWIFQQPIEEECDTEDEIREEIKTTIVHEVAHFFGLDDDYLEDLGY